MHAIELDNVALDYVVELNLSYILTVARDKSKGLLEVLSNIYPPYKEDVMTAARQLSRHKPGGLRQIRGEIGRHRLGVKKEAK